MLMLFVLGAVLCVSKEYGVCAGVGEAALFLLINIIFLFIYVCIYVFIYSFFGPVKSGRLMQREEGRVCE